MLYYVVILIAKLTINKVIITVNIPKKILKTLSLKDSWIYFGKKSEQGLTWCDGDNVPKSRIDCFPFRLFMFHT